MSAGCGGLGLDTVGGGLAIGAVTTWFCEEAADAMSTEDGGGSALGAGGN